MSLLLVLLSADMSTAAAKSAERRGGSDFFYYNAPDCRFSDYPVIADYDQQKATIDSDLARMYANGQRRLRLAFALGPRHRSVMTPSGDDLAPEFRTNLTALLKTIKQDGFEEIVFMIGGVVEAPHHWKEWKEDIYRMDWNEVTHVRPILAASGLSYRIDLFTEGSPVKGLPMMLQFARRLWADYTRAFGKADTGGFSIIPDIRQDRFSLLREVYGDTAPDVIDLHFYSNANGSETPYNRFINAHRRLAAIGFGHVPWIIGESYYNDPTEAAELSRAIGETGQRVEYLLQWPLSRRSPGASGSAACAVDVVPTEFNNYIAAGF